MAEREPSGPEIVARGSDCRPTNPGRSLHRSTAQTPGVEDGDGTVLSRRVESPGIGARLVPLAFMGAVAAGVGGLAYLTSPAARPTLEDELLIFLLTGAALALPWWFRNVVWPDDPRDSRRPDERR